MTTHDDTPKLGGDQQWHAGRGAFAVVATGFEREIEGRASRARTGLMEGQHFGVGFAGFPMVGPADDAAA